MAALSFSENEVDMFTLRKAPFRMILSRARSLLTESSDIEQIEIAEAVDGLAFDLLECNQRMRLAKAVFDGATILKDDIEGGRPLEEPVLPRIEEKLDELLDFMAAHMS